MYDYEDTIFFILPFLYDHVAVEDRKDWLRGFKTGTHADYNVETVTYESFINKELILFSVGNDMDVPAVF